MNTNHHGGFDYTYDPDVKAAVEAQEKKANALKVDSVQGMAGAGVNQRLVQANTNHHGGFDYTYDPDVKAAVEVQEKKANALKVDSVQGMAGAGVN